MANPEKGEFSLAMGGRRYTLKVGAAALRECQEALVENGNAPTIDELMRQVKVGRLKYVRALLWAGLQKHHADFTLDAVDDLIDQCEPAEVRSLLGNLGVSMQPDPADLKALGLDRPTDASRPPETGRQARKRASRNGGGRSTSPAAKPD